MKLLTATALAVLLAFPAVAQQSNCGPRDKVIAALAEKYNETRQSVGLMQGGQAVLEVFASESGSWTVITTNPNGMACIRASGSNYEKVTEELPAEGVPG